MVTAFFAVPMLLEGACLVPDCMMRIPYNAGTDRKKSKGEIPPSCRFSTEMADIKERICHMEA